MRARQSQRPEAPERGRIAPYDFRRPSRVAKEQLRGLQALHEDWAKLCGVSLSGLARAMVELRLAGLEQVPFGQWQAALAPPTCLVPFAMPPLRGAAVLEIGHPASAALLRRLLGGTTFDAPAAPREFTEIERAALAQIGARALSDLGQAWRGVGVSGVEPAGPESNPQTLRVAAPNELALVASFHLRMGPVEGPLALAYPYGTLEPVLARLEAQAATPTAARAPAWRDRLVRELGQSALTLRVVLGGARLTVRQLLELAPGQVLWLDRGPADPVVVEIEGRPRLLARAGTRRRRVAVEIVRPAEEVKWP